MTKREKVLTSITSVSLAIAIATSSVLCYHIAWNQGRFHPFHYKPEDIMVISCHLDVKGDPSEYAGQGTTWDAKNIKKIITLLNGFTATSEEYLTTLPRLNQTLFSFWIRMATIR